MKIFLSGSTSFLGSKFIQLYQDGFDILGFSKTDPKNPINMLDRPSLEKAFNSFNPDATIHLAAIVDQNDPNVKSNNIKGTQNLVDLAVSKNLPFVFMSSESVYGGKEVTGNYKESDKYQPRSTYAETKVESEKILKKTKLPFLILRAHRFVGINPHYHKPKQFPDTIKALKSGKKVHLDSKKLFKPCLINHISQAISYYLKNENNKRRIINIGVNKSTTYFDFISDVSKTLGFNQDLISPDGEETGWPQNSTLNLDRLHKLGYPTLEYNDLISTLKSEYKNAS